MYELNTTVTFEAAHALVGNFGPATQMHGHTYRLDATVRGERLQPDGTLLNVLLVQDVLATLVADMHYRDLATVPWLAGVNTTVEQMAHHCWERIAAVLRDEPVISLRVQVWENERVWAARDAVLNTAAGDTA